MWKDKVLWGSRSSLGMIWNKFSWWVMGAWTHILFSFSIQKDFHTDVCFALTHSFYLHCFSKTSERKHWRKGSIPGVIRVSGRMVLVECCNCLLLIFPSKEFQNEWSALYIPDVVINQNFGTFELKFNSLKFSSANQTFTKMCLYNGSHDFLSAIRPGLHESVSSEPHTVL